MPQHGRLDSCRNPGGTSATRGYTSRHSHDQRAHMVQKKGPSRIKRMLNFDCSRSTGPTDVGQLRRRTDTCVIWLAYSDSFSFAHVLQFRAFCSEGLHLSFTLRGW